MLARYRHVCYYVYQVRSSTPFPLREDYGHSCLPHTGSLTAVSDKVVSKAGCQPEIGR